MKVGTIMKSERTNLTTLFVEGDALPSLRGQKCDGCGRISFPPNPYGCEKCGATAAMLADHPLSGHGQVLALVTTNHANQRNLPVPYTVASIMLEDGPVIRALMRDTTGESLTVGDKVEAVVIEQTLADKGAADRVLRFQKCELV